MFLTSKCRVDWDIGLCTFWVFAYREPLCNASFPLRYHDVPWCRSIVWARPRAGIYHMGNTSPCVISLFSAPFAAPVLDAPPFPILAIYQLGFIWPNRYVCMGVQLNIDRALRLLYLKGLISGASVSSPSVFFFQSKCYFALVVSDKGFCSTWDLKSHKNLTIPQDPYPRGRTNFGPSQTTEQPGQKLLLVNVVGLV